MSQKILFHFKVAKQERRDGVDVPKRGFRHEGIEPVAKAAAAESDPW